MKWAHKKGYTTVKARGLNGNIVHVSVPKTGKLAGIAAHNNKKLNRARLQQIKEYKERLRAAKKKVPLEQRAHIKLEDL